MAGWCSGCAGCAGCAMCKPNPSCSSCSGCGGCIITPTPDGGLIYRANSKMPEKLMEYKYVQSRPSSQRFTLLVFYILLIQLN